MNLHWPSNRTNNLVPWYWLIPGLFLFMPIVVLDVLFDVVVMLYLMDIRRAETWRQDGLPLLERTSK